MKTDRKNLRWVLVAVLIGAGCDAGDRRSGPELDPQATPHRVTGEEVKTQAREAFDVTFEYLRQHGEELKAEAHRKLDEMRPQLEQWKADGRELGSEAKEKARKLLAELEEQREKLAAELERVKQSKEERRELVEDLKQKLGTAIAKIDQQIEALRRAIGSGATSEPTVSPTPQSTP